MSKFKVMLVILLVLGLILIVVFGLAINPAYAEDTGSIPVCHCVPKTHCNTLWVSEEGAANHLDQHEDDYPGECEPPSPAPDDPLPEMIKLWFSYVVNDKKPCPPPVCVNYPCGIE